MNKLHVIYDCVGWGYWNRAKSLCKYAPSNWQITMSDNLPNYEPNVILLLDYIRTVGISEKVRNRFKDTKFVSSFNTGGRRYNFAKQMIDLSDHVVMICKESYDKFGNHYKTSVIPNGVDFDIFRPSGDIILRPCKVLWCGSKSKAKIKGYHVAEKLKPYLKDKGIILDAKLTNSSRNTTTPQEMAEWYNTGTIFLVTSTNEGGPNPALEAAACGLPVIATKVGNMPELITPGKNGCLLENTDIETIYENIIKVQERISIYSTNMLDVIEPWRWENRSKQWFDLFSRLI